MGVSPHQSDSAIQRSAEKIILAKAAERLGMDLAPARLTIEGGAYVELDGAAPDHRVFVEVFARQGALKGGQQKKVCQDALKLITVRLSHPGARLVLAFADHGAAAYALKGTWVSQALAAWDVEVLIVDLAPAICDDIREAQARQIKLAVLGVP